MRYRIEIDQRLLAGVMQSAGFQSKNDCIEACLKLVVRQRQIEAELKKIGKVRRTVKRGKST